MLVIDAHEDSRIIVRTIALYAGFDVAEAVHERHGVELARQHAPVVIVVDLDGSRVAPADLASVLRAAVSPALVHLIALASPPLDRPAGCDGFAAILPKPIAVNALLHELQQADRPLDAW